MSTLSNPEIFRNILENLQTDVYVLDRDQKILFWKAGAERITGFLRQVVVGRFCRENLFASKDKTGSFAKEAATIEAVLRGGKAMTVNVLIATRWDTACWFARARCRFGTATDP